MNHAKSQMARARSSFETAEENLCGIAIRHAARARAIVGIDLRAPSTAS